jgi:hypothetical protein
MSRTAEIVVFPRYRTIKHGPVIEAEVGAPSRSATLINTLDSLIANMMAARGKSWTESVLHAAIERLGDIEP